MITAATLLRRIETLERGPEVQDVVLVYNAAETPCWPPEDSEEGQKSHPYRQMHIIVFEEFEGREPAKEPNNSKFFRPPKRLPKVSPWAF